jgi:hypothetical protein
MMKMTCSKKTRTSFAPEESNPLVREVDHGQNYALNIAAQDELRIAEKQSNRIKRDSGREIDIA